MGKIYKKIIWSSIILLVIILSNNIDNFYTNEFIEVVQKTINYNLRLNDKRLIGLRDAIATLNITSDSKEYITPIEGTIYKRYNKDHKGINILVYEEFVKAISSGEVIRVDEKQDGIEVLISHGEINAVYSNMNKSNVKKGERIVKGHIVGSMGDISKRDKYFYFEVWKDKLRIDPLVYIETNNKTPLSYE